jgi:hypothetical protein
MEDEGILPPQLAERPYDAGTGGMQASDQNRDCYDETALAPIAFLRFDYAVFPSGGFLTLPAAFQGARPAVGCRRQPEPDGSTYANTEV